ncbi:MAG: hypothetical protein LBT40_11795, partial [Deltaproteobacteria bacterium]|nr:hypothetical protein [Deltaproteobacteria bacterium]
MTHGMITSGGLFPGWRSRLLSRVTGRTLPPSGGGRALNRLYVFFDPDEPGSGAFLDGLCQELLDLSCIEQFWAPVRLSPCEDAPWTGRLSGLPAGSLSGPSEGHTSGPAARCAAGPGGPVLTVTDVSAYMDFLEAAAMDFEASPGRDTPPELANTVVLTRLCGRMEGRGHPALLWIEEGEFRCLFGVTRAAVLGERIPGMRLGALPRHRDAPALLRRHGAGPVSGPPRPFQDCRRTFHGEFPYVAGCPVPCPFPGGRAAGGVRPGPWSRPAVPLPRPSLPLPRPCVPGRFRTLQLTDSFLPGPPFRGGPARDLAGGGGGPARQDSFHVPPGPAQTSPVWAGSGRAASGRAAPARETAVAEAPAALEPGPGIGSSPVRPALAGSRAEGGSLLAAEGAAAAPGDFRDMRPFGTLGESGRLAGFGAFAVSGRSGGVLDPGESGRLAGFGAFAVSGRSGGVLDPGESGRHAGGGAFAVSGRSGGVRDRVVFGPLEVG